MSWRSNGGAEIIIQLKIVLESTKHNVWQFSSRIKPPLRLYTLKMSLSSIPTVETCGIYFFTMTPRVLLRIELASLLIVFSCA